MDKGFWGANVLLPIQLEKSNRHWLSRAKKNMGGKTVERLGDNEEIVELTVSSAAHTKQAGLPKVFCVRVIQYQRKGFQPERLVTSLLDSDKYPASELIELYHERWETELGYGEVKTKMLHSIPLRSKNVDRIRQEIWGILITYNLIRLEMERAAEAAEISPMRISFITVYRMIRDEWLWSALTNSPGAIPKHLQKLRDDTTSFILPERRRSRSYARAVKVKMSNYPKKRRQSVAKKLERSSKAK